MDAMGSKTHTTEDATGVYKFVTTLSRAVMAGVSKEPQSSFKASAPKFPTTVYAANEPYTRYYEAFLIYLGEFEYYCSSMHVPEEQKLMALRDGVERPIEGPRCPNVKPGRPE